MRFLDEFRDGALARRIADDIARITTRPWAIMEVCGGQTHAIIRHGVDQVLPDGVELIHGPGCPVCVTPLDVIDQAQAIAAMPGVVLCSYGDMLRVPGSTKDLLQVKSEGGDVRAVYSPMDAVALARSMPGRQIVFLAIGFETTAPANAMAVKVARHERLTNFSMLVSQALVPPAIEAIMTAPGNRVQAFLAAGHVCAVMGLRQYPELAARFHVPIVATGFEPVDVLDGIRRAIVQLETGAARVENAYGRVVSDEGNAAAQSVLAEVFEVTDRGWRGLGVIASSGWRLSEAYRGFDAALRFGVTSIAPQESPLCRSGEVLRGALKPTACAAFGTTCTPRTPLGATMVSGEGACAAYYHYGRTRDDHRPQPGREPSAPPS